MCPISASTSPQHLIYRTGSKENYLAPQQSPRIVLDILGVDPKLDPEPLLFKSIGGGSKQLNYDILGSV
jgi:hypothetical protein